MKDFNTTKKTLIPSFPFSFQLQGYQLLKPKCVTISYNFGTLRTGIVAKVGDGRGWASLPAWLNVN